MVVLPKNFVMTRYPGYFWNVVEKKLYSIKGSGELKPIKFNKGGFFNGHSIEPGYQISVDGTRRRYTMDYLNSLKPVKGIETIGVRE